MQRRGYAAKADIRDAFLGQKLCGDSVRFVGVYWEGVMYAFSSMIFGTANAPSQMQLITTAAIRTVLRRWATAGLSIGAAPGYDQVQAWPNPGDKLSHLMGYLDDFGMFFPTLKEAELGFRIFIDTCTDELGLDMHTKAGKLVPPCQKLEFLGVIFCLRTMTLSLSAERIGKMTADLQGILSMGLTTTSDHPHYHRRARPGELCVAELQHIIGVLQFATVVFAPCRPYLRQFYDALKGLGPRPLKHWHVPVSEGMLFDINTWLELLSALNGRAVAGTPVLSRTCNVHLYTDASFTGGGYFFGGKWKMWKWPSTWITQRIGNFSVDPQIFICELEAVALVIALREIVPLAGRPGTKLVMHIDNAPLVDMMRKMSTRSPACLPLIKEAVWLLSLYGISAVPTWIASGDNEVADILTRTDEVTAGEVLEVLRRWTNTHPDATCWVPHAPFRPELSRHLQPVHFGSDYGVGRGQ
jgi:hypothetical protein